MNKSLQNQRMVITPNVILAGAPRCATSSVFYWLADHPEVCASREKEPQFFIDRNFPLLKKDANYHFHGIEKYYDFFEHCKRDAKVIIEATANYIYNKTPLEALPKLRPIPKIILILRKPSKRTYSMYQFYRNNTGLLDKNVSFHDFIDMIKNHPEKLAKYKAQRAFCYAIESGKYVNYIRDWIETFGRENIHVFLLEHLKTNPVQFMKEISQKIGIDARFWDQYNFLLKNETYQVRNQKLHRVFVQKFWNQFTFPLDKKPPRTNKSLLSYFSFAYYGMIRPILPKSVRSFLLKSYFVLNTKKLSPPSAEDRQVMAELDKEFLPYNDALEKLLQIDLSCWKYSDGKLIKSSYRKSDMGER